MFIKPFRMAAQAFALKMSPRRMAAGLAIGTAAGMVPKGNLTAIVLMTVLCALQVNLAAGLLAVLVVSLIASLADPLFHEIGYAVLTAESLQSTWIWFFNQPLAAWTDLNNTVVMGSLIVGLISIYPVYRATRPVCERYAPVISERVRKWKVVMWLAGASVTDRLSAAAE